jgi:hypothetical protein
MRRIVAGQGARITSLPVLQFSERDLEAQAFRSCGQQSTRSIQLSEMAEGVAAVDDPVIICRTKGNGGLDGLAGAFQIVLQAGAIGKAKPSQAKRERAAAPL